MLAIYGVTGAERDRLMVIARAPDESGWLDTDLPGLPATSVTLATYERAARAITDWSPLLIPGLLQTMDHGRAYMLSDGIAEAEIGSRLMARQRRQEILQQLTYTAFIDETVLHRQIGGPNVLGRQLRHLIEMAEGSSAAIHVTPANDDAHAGLVSPFVLLEFSVGTPIVHVELARSGVFLTGAKDTAVYPATVNRLHTISLDREESARRLRQAAGAIGK